MAKKAKKKAVAKKRPVVKAKKKRVEAIPSRYSSVIPQFRVADASGCVAFLQQAFGAKVIDRHDGPGGVLVHAELKIGNVVLMCGDTHGAEAQTLSASMYVKNVDQVFAKAISLGATQRDAVDTKFYGDRSGRMVDAWGNEWVIATHVEDVSKKEMAKRMASMMQQGEQKAA